MGGKLGELEDGRKKLENGSSQNEDLYSGNVPTSDDNVFKLSPASQHPEQNSTTNCNRFADFSPNSLSCRGPGGAGMRDRLVPQAR